MQPLTEIEKSFAHSILKRIPFTQLLNFELVDIERGEATVKLQIENQHTRGDGFLHGGVTASLVDTVTAFAVATFTESPGNSVTVDLTIHFLRPVYGSEVTAKARVLRAGKRLFTVTAEVFDQSGELAATALTTYSRINPSGGA